MKETKERNGRFSYFLYVFWKSITIKANTFVKKYNSSNFRTGEMERKSWICWKKVSILLEKLSPEEARIRQFRKQSKL